MPLYEYRCECGKEQTAYRSVATRRQAPACCGVVSLVISAPHVMPDIEPYRTVAADKESGKRMNITSRRTHREFLARNGYEEIGNDSMGLETSHE